MEPTMFETRLKFSGDLNNYLSIAEEHARVSIELPNQNMMQIARTEGFMSYEHTHYTQTEITLLYLY